MKRILISAVCALGLLLWAGQGQAAAQLSLSIEAPSEGQTFQAQAYPAYPPDRGFVRFVVRVSGPYLSGDVLAVVSKDPTSLAQGSTSGQWVPLECGPAGIFAVCDQEIMGWVSPGSYYWRPYMPVGVFGTPSSFQFGGPYWGEMSSFSVLPVPSLRMTRSQAIRYAKSITRKEVRAEAAFVSCKARAPSRYFCSTQAYKGRAIWALEFIVWHSNEGGSVVAKYRVTFKKKY